MEFRYVLEVPLSLEPYYGDLLLVFYGSQQVAVVVLYGGQSG